jgi:transcriptional regulator with XRE-family HTH domain
VNFNATKEPDAVDTHVGKRICVQRCARKMSQTRLGEIVGVSFQQIQKYEKGVNRVGIGRLQRIAAALEVDVNWFLQGGPASTETEYGQGAELVTQMLSTVTGSKLARAFIAIGDGAKRRALIQIAEAFAAADAIEKAAEAA